MNEIERSRMLPDSDLLRSFLTVAEHGNLTKAADRLGRTQSAVSVQIKRLETVLAARLFERQARGMVLTDAGERRLPAASRVLADLERVGAMFARPLAGRVRIGIPDDYGTTILQDILNRFARSHPQVDVAVRCGFSARFPAELQRNRLDVAVYAADDTDNAGETILEERAVWAAGETWSGSKDEPVPLALFDRDCWWRDVVLETLDRTKRPYRIAFSSESVWGVKAAIAGGLAVGMLAESTLEPGMRVLGKRQGFPDLPPSCLVLAKAPKAGGDATDAMAAAIRDGFRQHRRRPHR